jgi:hypothetical protein
LFWSVFVFTHAALEPVPQRVGNVAFGQVPTQAPLAQANVPSVGRAGHVAHAVPHRIVPVGQLLQTPPAQLVPVGQAWPQLPQLLALLDVSTSQPLAGL